MKLTPQHTYIVLISCLTALVTGLAFFILEQDDKPSQVRQKDGDRTGRVPRVTPPHGHMHQRDHEPANASDADEDFTLPTGHNAAVTTAANRSQARLKRLVADNTNAQELLHTQVYIIVDKHLRFDYAKRYAATRKLHQINCSDADVRALQSLLLRKDRRLANRDMEDMAIRNDVLRFLLQQSPVHPTVADTMLTILDDDTYHETWREYVVQFIPTHPCFKQTTDTARHQRQAFLHAIDRLHTHNDVLLGSAIIALGRIADQTDAHGAGQLRIDYAKKALTSPEFGLPARITAMQVARTTDDPDLRDHARTIAADPDQHYQLRMSALAALRATSRPQDRRLCQQIAEATDNKHVRRAALLHTQ